jgi:hypothetical protein
MFPLGSATVTPQLLLLGSVIVFVHTWPVGLGGCPCLAAAHREREDVGGTCCCGAGTDNLPARVEAGDGLARRT